jgi:hypothetical protein
MALTVTLLGLLSTVAYAFGTPGRHWAYLGLGFLVDLAAWLSGMLIGFLFGIPRAISSGQTRQTAQTPALTPSSNLAEVSDWLTKLLLGAGLVSLTKLGHPLGGLIDSLASGLSSPAVSGTLASAKAATAGALFGFSALGFLIGYVSTTMWYQERLSKTLAGFSSPSAS